MQLDLAPEAVAELSGEFAISALEETGVIAKKIESMLILATWNDSDVFGVKLSIEEALVNSIKHAHQLDPNKVVKGSYILQGDTFHFECTDEGPGFNPEDLPDPTAPENVERPNGRGVFLMKELMTTVDYSKGGRAVQLTKISTGTRELVDQALQDTVLEAQKLV